MEELQLYQITIFSAWCKPITIGGLSLQEAIEQRQEYREQQFKVELSEEEN
jgi:hypothetical protein